MMDKLANVEYGQNLPKSFRHQRGAYPSIHTYRQAGRQTDRHGYGIPKTTFFGLRGLKTCKSIKIVRLVSLSITVLSFTAYMRK
jgi:hypothetical protein